MELFCENTNTSDDTFTSDTEMSDITTGESGISDTPEQPPVVVHIDNNISNNSPTRIVVQSDYSRDGTVEKDNNSKDNKADKIESDDDSSSKKSTEMSDITTGESFFFDTPEQPPVVVHIDNTISNNSPTRIVVQSDYLREGTVEKDNNSEDNKADKIESDDDSSS